MSNRYSKTGFTSRQEDTLRRINSKLLDILEDRSGKQDDPETFRLLMRAHDSILYALEASKEWKLS